MKITYQLSEQALQARYIETGVRRPAMAIYDLDESTLTPAQREQVWPYAKSTFGFRLERFCYHPATKSISGAIHGRIVGTLLVLDADPTVEDILAHLERMNGEREACQVAMDVDEANYQALHAEARAESLARLDSQKARLEAAIQSRESARLAKATIAWNDQGMAILNLQEAVLACADLLDASTPWVLQVEGLSDDPDRIFLGFWINDRTIELTQGERRTFLAAGNIGSKHRPRWLIRLIVLDGETLIYTGIETYKTPGWQLRLRDDVRLAWQPN